MRPWISTIARAVAIGLLGSLAIAPAAADEQRTQGILAAGTPFETTWYAFDSGEPGPTVLVTGGVHGNEPAGARAARQIADWTVKRGRLIVLPRANEPSLAARRRRIPGLKGDAGDLNRHFPRRDAAAAPTSEHAARIWSFVCAQEPNVLLDLHEGYGFRAAGSKSVGSSVLTGRAEDEAHQQIMLAAVNSEIDDPKRRFSDLDSIVAGSLARAAIEQLGIEAHILETTHREQPLSRRCRQHRRMVAALLRELEMADATAGTLVSTTEARPKIALYDGPGAGSQPQGALFEKCLASCRVERIGPADVDDGALERFDVVLFPGGSGSQQGKALGASGRDMVRAFVDAGGGYLGVCAGAYLALYNYDWGLKLLPLDSIDRAHWRRGRGTVVIEPTAAGGSLLGLDPGTSIEIHFGQGPLMAPTEKSDLPAPEVLSYYRTGIGINGADPSTMVDTPAIVAGNFGSGRVMLFSPHPEKTEGLEKLIERAARWGSGASAPTDDRPTEPRTPVPDFTVTPLPERGALAVFRPTFVKHTRVFDVLIVATEKTGDAKVRHAANILAQYLDNDEDGVIDDPAAHRVLVDEGAFLVMFATERDAQRARLDHRKVERAGFRIGQDLYGEETIPDGPPHRKRRGRFDASLEEVLHLVSNGWREAHPEAFGYEPGSRLTDAMDLARGGRFERIPRRYPDRAWYHYDDRSCDYECMAAEYLYWALTSLLGGQDYPGRAEEIEIEWQCPTASLLRSRDPAVTSLLTDPQFRLPKTLPDGSYRN